MFASILFRLGSILPSRLFWDLFTPAFIADPWQHQIRPQHWWLLNLIITKKPPTILEVGCGFGRNLQFLIDQSITPSRLTGVDFSARLFHQAKTNLPKAIKLYLAPIQKLPFSANKFGLVFTHGLLMHLRPSQITLALTELLRVSQRWLIIIEETRSKPQKINSFTWAHDYLKFFKLFNLTVVDSRRDKHHLSWYLLQKP